VRRIFGWIGGAVGGITAYRWLRERPEVAPEAAAPEPDTRAEELRERLAESRAAESVVVEGPPAEPVAEKKPAPEPLAEEEPAPAPESPEERRERVHEEGRAALDEMKSE
jgi:hypothetical protein